MHQNLLKNIGIISTIMCAMLTGLASAAPDNGTATAQPTKPEAGAFNQITANTIYTAKVLTELNNLVNKRVEKKTIELINKDLYGTSLSGEPVEPDANLAFLHKHSNAFCSPLSGRELTMFKNCNANTPLLLQHADIRSLIFGQSKLNADLIPVVENWIRNFGVSPVDSEIPEYIYDPKLLSNPHNQKDYVARLRRGLWGAIRAESLSRMLARRIPVDLKDPNSPSIASAMEQEVKGRFLSPKWHDEVGKTGTQLDIAKEQLRVLALISMQMQELNERIERLEMLETSIMTLLANQQEQISEVTKKVQ